MGWASSGWGHSKARGKAIKGCVPTAASSQAPPPATPQWDGPSVGALGSSSARLDEAAVGIGRLVAVASGEVSCSYRTR